MHKCAHSQMTTHKRNRNAPTYCMITLINSLRLKSRFLYFCSLCVRFEHIRKQRHWPNQISHRLSPAQECAFARTHSWNHANGYAWFQYCGSRTTKLARLISIKIGDWVIQSQKLFTHILFGVVEKKNNRKTWIMTIVFAVWIASLAFAILY